MKPLFSLLLILLLASALITRAADNKPSLSAEEIISKHLEAAGGKERLSKFKSRIAIGTVKKENDPEGKMAIMSEAPNHLAAVFILPSYDLRFSYDGNNAAVRPQIPRGYAVFDNKYREMAASGLMFNGISLHNLLLHPTEDVKFEAKGMKKVRGRDAYVVEAKRGKGDAMRLYFDAENFMWVRTDYGRVQASREMRAFTNDPVYHGEDEIIVDFYIETSDFRDVDGVKLPFKFEQILTAPFLKKAKSGSITGTISEYRHNEQIDPSMFK